ncbi:MAG: 50S ribosomal protein L22 [Calditrichaeota bacterium]|nr:50S ribosomal protein L22 [Calditrichota bacterium]MCB9366217.1 50S ribosomal protein L22 [Calditrichota bacterium]MCB9391714.1 50S ribosomal protein L22 [Calditrichota bacterium]
MEARCVARFVRVTPRKMRLVADLVRGKNVNEAINILKFTTRSASSPTLKAIQSAVANYAQLFEASSAEIDSLLVRTIFADEGPTMHRFMPRAQGRATPIKKRMTHLTVVVAPPAASEEAEKDTAAEAAEKPVKKSAAKKAAKKSAAKKPATKKSSPRKTKS